MNEKENKPFLRTLPVRLTREELLARADELSHKHGEQEEEERTQSDMKASMKSRMERLKLEITGIARVIREKAEDRMVECQERFDYEAKVVETFRLDTGEVVGSRGMTADERNLSLFPQATDVKAN